MSITLTRPQQRVQLCTNLNLKSEHEAAVAALAEVRKASVGDERENGSPAVREATERVTALEAEMREHTLTFTLQAWPRKIWTEFEELHKTREGREDDKQYNIDVPALDLVLTGEKTTDHDWPAAIVSVKDPNGDDVPFVPASDWMPLADEMTEGQWTDFALAILLLNRGVTAAPFSPLASALSRKFAETSKQPSA